MSSRLVLVVEDDDLLRELIATALEVRGYAVQTAATIVEAKRLFHATDPDGLVLDVVLKFEKLLLKFNEAVKKTEEKAKVDAILINIRDNLKEEV